MTLENISTIEKENLKEKAQNKQKKKNKSIKIYRSFLTFVIILCIFQMGRSAFLNISKAIMYQNKISQSKKLKEEAKKEHEILEKSINSNEAYEQIESIARNNLKMAAKNEVLIIINKTQEDENQEDESMRDKFLKYFLNFMEKESGQ